MNKDDGSQPDQGQPASSEDAEEEPSSRYSLQLRICATLLLGTIGGWVFYWLEMPLAWMIGALIFTTVTALAGAPLARSNRLRHLVVPVLGVMLGSAFTPDTVDQMATWFPSLITLVVYVAFITMVVGFYLWRYAGFGPVTSYFSAAPGGFSEMLILGEAYGGDDRRISLIHSIRILLTVMLIPFWFKFFEGYQPGNMTALGTVTDFALQDALILIACGFIGYFGAQAVRLPNAALLGPTIVSAAVHLGGITDAKPPQEVVAVAQVILGAGIGCRFVGVSVRRVFRTMAHGAGVTVFMLVAAIFFAYELSELTGLPFLALWLAFAPGGLAEMTLISLSVGIDTALVSTHHMVRMLVMVGGAPLAFALLSKRFDMSEKEGEAMGAPTKPKR